MHAASVNLAERDVKSQCVDWLQLKGWKCIRLQSGTVRGLTRGSYINLGENGLPDYICVRPSRVECDDSWFLELKRPGGKLRPAQEKWIDSHRHVGFTICVADSLEVLQDWYAVNIES